MKHLILMLSLVILGIVSCKKELTPISDDPVSIKILQASLKDSLPAIDYAALDLKKIYISEIPESKFFIARIPFSGKKPENDFVLVQLNKDGTIERGRIIHIEGGVENKVSDYNGSIVISTLQGTKITESEIEHGLIKAFHPEVFNLRINVLQPVVPGIIVLPEVVVVGYIHAAPISYSTWYNLLALLGIPMTGWMGPYNPALAGGGGNAGGGNGIEPGYDSPPVIYGTPIEIDFENQYGNPAVDLQKYVNCFNALPDAGATCSMTLYTDIPIDGDPTKFFDWHNGSPGHTFIQFQKQNAGQLVSQNIGFYPESGWKTTLTPAPIAGKFVDNQYHEFNASLQVNISPAQLQTGLIRMLYLANFIRYDIDEYNCTDFALEVFNDVVAPGQRLAIPLFDIPGGSAPFGTSTPNGLYLKMLELKQSGGPLSAGITIPQVGWAGASKGPCN